MRSPLRQGACNARRRTEAPGERAEVAGGSLPRARAAHRVGGLVRPVGGPAGGERGGGSRRGG
eukprot:8488094-Alexandrium_andersonii.AAC.1